MKRPWTRLLCLALPLVAGCPADDSESGDEGANTSSESNGTTPTSGSGSGSETDPTEADGSSTDDSSAELGCAANIEHDTTDGASNDLQMTWGAPCSEDSECVALLGEGGRCMFEAVIYELPQGYCSKDCTLPSGTMYSLDDPQCDPNGGVDCIGQAPLLQVCAVQCTDDDQCSRDGYTCRNFPLIATDGDPTYCLMPDCCEDTCEE